MHLLLLNEYLRMNLLYAVKSDDIISFKLTRYAAGQTKTQFINIMTSLRIPS